jgi:probable F420-dependent oxidoreductase
MKTGIKPELTVWALTFSPTGDYDWQASFDVAVAADRAGVDRIGLTGEHVAFGENLEAYARPELGGIKGGKQVTGPDGYYIEPVVTMAMMAGQTRRIRFVSNIMLAALRRPFVLAKMLSTLDYLSGGRVDLGVGVGWQEEEYAAAGLEFKDRGRLLDHTLEVCQLLWREGRASYSSPELSFENIHMMPKPANPDGIPIWVSGTLGAPAMRRLARFGSGWIPWGDAVADEASFIEAIPRMREAVAKVGGDPATIGVAGNLPLAAGPDGNFAIAATMNRVPALVEAGVTDFRAMLPVPRDHAAGEDYLAPWVETFRAATR